MDNIAVPSRFACLKIEDDDFQPARSRENKKKTDKQNSKKQSKGSKSESNEKKMTNKQIAPKKPKNKPQPTAKQWEEWKERDSELVLENYEQDLESAIMLSQLDYEEKKDLYKQLEKEADNKNGLANKKKKNKAMSLEQFLGNNQSGIESKKNVDSSNENVPKDENFFEQIQQAAKKATTKEQLMQKLKEREENIEEIITISHYQEKLKKEIAKNAGLQLELDKTKEEIIDVKTRNKVLCGILGHGEMKDKADVLIELERLNGVKNELTDEVTRLHGLLEQERSKVAALTSELQHKHKDKGRKQN